MNRAAFALIKNDKNQVLLVKSLTNPAYVGHWSLPGGIVEAGESLKDGATREVFEEVGLRCTINKQLRQIENKVAHLTVTTFAATYVSGEITLQADEISDAQWFNVKETKGLLIGYNIQDLLS
jgi:NAD+ diphosphatase